MMKSVLILLLFTLTFTVRLSAQNQNELNGGSPYSIFGIGDLNYYTSTRTYSMGILGTALFGNYTNNLNPAALTKLKFTNLNTNVIYGFLKSTSSVSENNISDGNVVGINLGIPFDQVRGWGMSIGFNPMSFVNYRIRLNGKVGSQSYTQTYSGDGGISRISAAMCYNILRKVSIGVEYNFGFGEIRNLDYINFNNTNYTNTLISKETDFQKSFFKGGIIIEVGKILKSLSIRHLSLGFAYQQSISFESNQDKIYTSSISIDTVKYLTGVSVIPAYYSFGITNLFGKKYLVSGDIMLQDWSQFSQLGVTNNNFGNSYRAGLGIEIIPSPDNFSFWGTMTYRFGGFYEKSYYKVNGQDVTGFGVRAGVNIPISRFNSFDFGINYSVKGKTEFGLIKDQFLNLTLGVNFGELWFLRPSDEDK